MGTTAGRWILGWRRTGLGEQLAVQLLEGSRNKTAILTTQTDNKPARTLYQKLDWVVDKEEFYPGDIAPYVIMGKILSE